MDFADVLLQVTPSSDQIQTTGSTMAPKKHGQYQTDGINYYNRTQLIEKTNLPPKLKCKTCNYNKMQAQFSNNQLDAYCKAIRTNGVALAERPVCMLCVGVPKTEMKCTQCDVTKGFDHFTKAQRKNPDHARCKNCVQSNLDQEPEVQDALEEELIIETLSGSARGSLSGLSTISSISQSLPSINGSNSSNFSRRRGNYEDDGVWDPNDGAVSPRTGFPHMTSGQRQYPSIPSSASSDTSSIALSDTVWAAFGQVNQPNRPRALGSSSVTSGLEEIAGGPRDTNRGFAKQGAVKKTKGERAMEAVSRDELKRQEQLACQHHEDSDSEGSDWEP